MNLQLTVQVPRSPDLNQILDRFQQKLTPLLFAFQPELVQLHGRLVRHTSREGVVCRLNLHLPTGQISSEHIAATAQAALRAAGEDLLRQLHKHKQRLRETRPRWHRPRYRRRAVHAAASASRQSDLAAYLGGHYEHLLGFVRRQIVLREHLGELAPGWLDPQEVLDEVVVAALEAKPAAAAMNRGRWFLLLAADAIRRLAKTYGDRRHGLGVASLADDLRALDAGADGSDDGAVEPPRLEDFIAANYANPEESAAAAEAMARLAAVVARLPGQQRHDLVLYLLEGFRPAELARMTQRSQAEVIASLEQAENGLKLLPDLPHLLRHRLPLGLPVEERRKRRSSRRDLRPLQA
ncbi:MAG TPA: hypothetical protein VN690_09765 [Terriglobales bacterium]|nr:hypothetical protein [Terriglobales bacterium]